MRLAEGVQAESAAEGLAAVQVRDKEAEAIEKAGRAEAEATEARLRAEAEGVRAKALAEAAAIGEKLKAEAEGLTEKAGAMAALDEESRGQEEYRLRIQAEKEIRLAGLDVHRHVAEAQATVIATGLENADINVVGGESVFFGRLVSSIELGNGVDGFVQHPETAQALAKPWLDGELHRRPEPDPQLGGDLRCPESDRLRTADEADEERRRHPRRATAATDRQGR